MNNIKQVFASMDGAEIPGGCDHCDAYQSMSMDGLGIMHITVHHDDWCPFLANIKNRRVEEWPTTQ